MRSSGGFLSNNKALSADTAIQSQTSTESSRLPLPPLQLHTLDLFLQAPVQQTTIVAERIRGRALGFPELFIWASRPNISSASLLLLLVLYAASIPPPTAHCPLPTALTGTLPQPT